jgi:hypothetical protein
MDNLIEEYISLATKHGETTLTGDYKVGNKIHAKLMKIIERIRNADNVTKTQFVNLMYHNNVSVKIWTAGTLLKTYESEALSVLKGIEDNKDIFGLIAKTSIDSWRKGLLTNLVKWDFNK